MYSLAVHSTHQPSLRPEFPIYRSNDFNEAYHLYEITLTTDLEVNRKRGAHYQSDNNWFQNIDEL